MVREELVAAIRNALERGTNLQAAVQSLISAGYDLREVQEAAQQANSNASIIQNLPTKLPIQNQNRKQERNSDNMREELEAPVPINQQNIQIADSGYKKLPTTQIQTTQTQNNEQNKPKSRVSKWIIIPLVIIGILIILLLFFIILGDKILQMLFK